MLFDLEKKLTDLHNAYKNRSLADCVKIIKAIFLTTDEFDDAFTSQDDPFYIPIRERFLNSNTFQHIIVDAYTKQSVQMLALFTALLNPSHPSTQKILSQVKESAVYDPDFTLAQHEDLNTEYFKNALSPLLIDISLSSPTTIPWEQLIKESMNYKELFYTEILLKTYLHHKQFLFRVHAAEIKNSPIKSLLIKNEYFLPLIALYINFSENDRSYYFNLFLNKTIHDNNSAAMRFLLKLDANTIISHRDALNRCIKEGFTDGVIELVKHYTPAQLTDTLLPENAADEIDVSLAIAANEWSKQMVVVLIQTLIDCPDKEPLLLEVIKFLFTYDSYYSELTCGAVIYALCSKKEISPEKLMQLFISLPKEKITKALAALPQVFTSKMDWTEFNYFPLMHYFMAEQAGYAEKFTALATKYSFKPTASINFWLNLSADTPILSKAIKHLEEIRDSFRNVALVSHHFGSSQFLGKLNGDGFNHVLYQLLPPEIRKEFKNTNLTLYVSALRQTFLNKNKNQEHPPELHFIDALKNPQKIEQSNDPKKTHPLANSPGLFAEKPRKKPRYDNAEITELSDKENTSVVVGSFSGS